MTPSELKKLENTAAKKPLAVMVRGKQGHIVGIPPKLRKYEDPIFRLMPGSVRTAVEIGTLQGWFAWRCMKYLPETASLYCVDPFVNDPAAGYDGEYNFQCWKRNLRPWFGKRCFIKRGPSEDVARDWGSAAPIDFLFIDGDHRQAAVMADLQSWVPKVRPGGLVAGHDIEGTWGPQVKAALEAFCPKWGVPEVNIGEIYSFTGTQVTPCWWFYQPQK